MVRKNDPAKNMGTTAFEIKTTEQMFHFQGAVEIVEATMYNFYINLKAMLKVRMREISQTQKKKF